MIRDTLLQFTTSSGFSPTSTGDNIADNTIDTSPLTLPTGSGGGSTPGFNSGSSTNAGRDLGVGGEMWFEVLVTAAVTSGGTTGVIFDLCTDATATMASVVHSTGVGILVSSPSFVKATLIAGFTYRVQLPASQSYLRYLGMNVNIATNSLTAGTFEGKFIINIQQSDLYQSGFAVQ